MTPISHKYRHFFVELMKSTTRHSQEISTDNVFQKANPAPRPMIDRMVAEHLLPGSDFKGLENLYELHDLCAQGRSCLILMEHYSNFDLPAFMYLLSGKGARGKEIADCIVAIAGMKLNEDSKVVLAFSEAYTRIVIYPSRYFDGITDPDRLAAERKRSSAINRSSLHEMVRCKHSGHIILVFPTGTRYRPGNPDTKRGLKEIDSYLKSFDYMVFVGSSGNILRINPDAEMTEDLICEDRVVFKAGPVIKCHEFRDKVRAEAPADADLKQFVVDRVMAELDRVHAELEAG
jgi:hypothetical protein